MMEEVNSTDRILVAFLEKKCKEMLSTNLVLEAKLVVEQTKSKDINQSIQNEIDQADNLRLIIEKKDQDIAHLNNEFRACVDDKNKIIQDRNELNGKVNQLQNQLNRETSVKDSILNEYKMLKSSCDAQIAEKTNEIESFKLKLADIQSSLIYKDNELNALKVEYDALKSQINTKKSK
jgi:chromosome segregation ATPase